MRAMSKYVVSVVGSGALVVSVLTNAFASHPTPLHTASAATQTVKGNLTVNGVIHAKRNETVYGNFYTKGKAEIYKGLTIRANGLTVTSGGVKSDTLDVTGALHAVSGTIDQNLNVTGNVQAATLAGTSLTLSGGATMGGALTSTGKITANGVDAGAGGLSTTGALTAGSTTVSSLTDTGSLAAGSLTVTGAVNFTNATVTGLNLSNIIGTGNLTLANLTLGAPTSTSPPLFLASNGKTATVTVDTLGNVVIPSLSSLGNATVAGNLAVNGSGGITTGTISAPVNSSNALTPLALTGSTITLTGATTVAGALTENGATSLNGSATVNGNNDLTLASTTGSGATASHLVGNKDVDGQVSVTVAANATTSQDQVSAVVPFTRPYTTFPTVVVTAAQDPQPWTTSAPKVWVSLHQNAQGQYDGFNLHYLPSATAPASATTITYNYHVVG